MEAPHYIGAAMTFLCGTAYGIIDCCVSIRLHNKQRAACDVTAKAVIVCMTIASLIASILAPVN